MNIFLLCFIVNFCGAVTSYIGNSTTLMSLNVAFALFNGIAYLLSYREEE